MFIIENMLKFIVKYGLALWNDVFMKLMVQIFRFGDPGELTLLGMSAERVASIQNHDGRSDL